MGEKPESREEEESALELSAPEDSENLLVLSTPESQKSQAISEEEEEETQEEESEIVRGEKEKEEEGEKVASPGDPPLRANEAQPSEDSGERASGDMLSVEEGLRRSEDLSVDSGENGVASEDDEKALSIASVEERQTGEDTPNEWPEARDSDGRDTHEAHASVDGESADSAIISFNNTRTDAPEEMAEVQALKVDSMEVEEETQLDASRQDSIDDTTESTDSGEEPWVDHMTTAESGEGPKADHVTTVENGAGPTVDHMTVSIEVASIALDHSYCTPEVPDSNPVPVELAVPLSVSDPSPVTLPSTYDTNRFKLSSGGNDHTYCSSPRGDTREQAMDTASLSSSSPPSSSTQPQGIESQELFASEPVDHVMPDSEQALTAVYNGQQNDHLATEPSSTTQIVLSAVTHSSDVVCSALTSSDVETSTRSQSEPPFLSTILTALQENPLLSVVAEVRKTLGDLPDPLGALDTGTMVGHRPEELLPLHRALTTQHQALAELGQELADRQRRIVEVQALIMREVEKAFVPNS